MQEKHNQIIKRMLYPAVRTATGYFYEKLTILNQRKNMRMKLPTKEVNYE